MTREEYVKEKIKEQGYNIKQFAIKIGMNYTTLLSIVNHSLGGATFDNVIKICDGLGLDVEQLNPNKDKEKAVTDYDRLNKVGKDKADEYIKDLLVNPKYTETDAPAPSISDTIADDIRKIQSLRIPTH